MAAGWGHALAATVGGFRQGREYAASQVEQADDLKWRTEQRKVAAQKQADEIALRQELRQAAQPMAMTHGAGGWEKPPEMDNRDVGQTDNFKPMAQVVGNELVQGGMAPPPNGGLTPAQYRVGGVAYPDQTTAEAAAAAGNSPAAVAGRQAQVYAKRGMPTQAAALESRQDDLLKKAQELKKAGVFEGLQHFRSGNKDGALKALKSSGMFNLADGDAVITPRDIDLPGIGKVKTYDMTFNQKGEDGVVQKTTVNSHDLSLAAMPYEKQLELQRKGTKDETTADNQATRLDIAAQKVAIAGDLAEARIAKLQAGGGSGRGGASERAERTQARTMLTGLQQGMNAELRDIETQIKAAMPKFAVPNAPLPQAVVELQAQRKAVLQRKADVDQQLLSLLDEVRPAMAQTLGAAPAGAKKPAASAPAASGKKDFSNLWK